MYIYINEYKDQAHAIAKTFNASTNDTFLST